MKILTPTIEVNLMGKYKLVRHSFYLQQIFLYLTNFLLKTLKICENVKLSTLLFSFVNRTTHSFQKKIQSKCSAGLTFNNCSNNDKIKETQ